MNNNDDRVVFINRQTLLNYLRLFVLVGCCLIQILFINSTTLRQKKKTKLIKDNQNGNDLSVRQLADKYNVSKSSVTNILRYRKEFLFNYISNYNKTIKHKHNEEDGKTIDQLIFE